MWNYIFVGDGNDYTRYAIEDISKSIDEVIGCEPPSIRLKGIRWFLYKCHNSNGYKGLHFHIPFREIWASEIISSEVCYFIRNSKNKNCFIFSSDGYRLIDIGAVDYLRKRFEGSIIIYAFQDKVEKYMMRKDFNLEVLRGTFDYLVTYNLDDLVKYHLFQSPPTSCNYSNVEDDVTLPETDLFYAGRIKPASPERLNKIIRIYEIATSLGLVCDFNVVGVNSEQQVYKSHITYNKPMTYSEMLKREKRSKCIVNILQDGVTGITLRENEAIGLNKLLLTNNMYIKQSPFYNPNMLIELNENINDECLKGVRNSKESWNGIPKYSIVDWNNWINGLLAHK